jgi:hypothetical protein
LSFKRRGFLNSLDIGHQGEEIWSGFLRSQGLSVYTPDPGKCGWDVMDSDGVVYEIKTDLKAVFYARRAKREPNFYMEYRSTVSGSDCGIMTAEADVLVYMLVNEDHTITAYTFDYKQLRKHLSSSEYESRGNKTSGDDNAIGWVMPVSVLISHPESGYRGSSIL